MRTLRANLISLAWDHPNLRKPILAMLRRARTYDEYVEDKKRKGEKPKSKKDWEAWGQGQERLESHGGKVDKLRKAMPQTMTDAQFDTLITSLSDVKDDEIKQLVALSKGGLDPDELRDWAQGSLPDSVNNWVDEQLRKEEADREKGEDSESLLQEFGLGLLDWFSETVDKGKG